jgi:hypothetical protein
LQKTKTRLDSSRASGQKRTVALFGLVGICPDFIEFGARNFLCLAMSEILERNKRAVSVGYWLPVAAGVVIAVVYVVGACTLGALCR